MGKINILTPDIYNLIAAGEVVERPASVVKELIENSIDAGASKINIDIVNGGISKIVVEDNGSGILPDDIRNAFKPHATSKISKAGDLDTIATLGFRGEALPSIASVSEVEMITKTEKADVASFIKLAAGSEIEFGQKNRHTGTTVIVSNLFFNTPARVKFLKSPKGEENIVTEIIKRQALANPYVSFSYTADGKKMLATDGKGIESSLYAALGAETAKNLIYKEVKKGNTFLKGYFIKPQFSKPTRASQIIMINGRVVVCPQLAFAVEKAYEGLLMKRNYPAFVLDLILPFDEVDINVHPAKTEVRLSDTSRLFGLIYNSAKEALAETSEYYSIKSEIIEYISDSVKEKAEKSLRDSEKLKTEFENFIIKDKNAAILSEVHKPSLINYSDSIKSDKTDRLKPLDDFLNFGFASRGIFKEGSEIENKILSDYFEKNEGQSDIFDAGERDLNYKIVGQLFSTYIILENGDEAYIIDQHAAQEKLLYDKLMASLSNPYSQALIMPYSQELDFDALEKITAIKPQLSGMGFDISLSGNKIEISAIPSLLIDIKLKEFISLAVSEIDTKQTISDLISDKLCQIACKAAIKGGDTLSDGQIKLLLNEFFNNGGIPVRCPHGRPALIKIDKIAIEKLFKRIV